MNNLEYRQDNHVEIKSKDLKKGDIFKIGTEQWVCLYTDQHRALMLSLLVLDIRSFDIMEFEPICYKDGSIHQYLNHNFLIDRFKRDFLPLMDSDVFLLSKEEVNLYLENKRAYDKFNNHESWWLRDQSEDHRKAYFVNKEGRVSTYPLGHHCRLGLRPAFWLKLNQKIDYNNGLKYVDKGIEIDKPFIGMDESSIKNTKCGPYYNSTLFSNYHVYIWKSGLDCNFLQVGVENGKVISVLEMYWDTHWNEDGSPIYQGIPFALRQ